MQELYTLNLNEFELSERIAKIEKILALNADTDIIKQNTNAEKAATIVANIFLNFGSETLKSCPYIVESIIYANHLRH